MASLKVEICLKKKNPPRAQIFRYFRIKSRNKNADQILFPSIMVLSFYTVCAMGKINSILQNYLKPKHGIF